MPLINQIQEVNLLACMMRDATIANKLVVAFPGCAANPEMLFGQPNHIQVASFIFSKRRRVLPSEITNEIRELGGFDPQRVWDEWTMAHNSRWHEFAKDLRELAVQRGVLGAIRKKNWSEPLDQVFDAVTELERDIKNVKGALIPYDSSAEARVRDFNEARASGRLGEVIMTDVVAWDTQLFPGIRQNETTVIHGRPKSYKTTTLLSLLVGVARRGVPVCHICAERGYDINDVTTSYLRLLTAHHYCRERHVQIPPHIISHDYLKYSEKYASELEFAILAAEKEYAALPIFTYARPTDQGGTGDLSTALGWAQLDFETRNNGGKMVFALDNLQSYRESGEPDYDLINRIAPPVTSLQSEYGMSSLIISQENEAGDVRGAPLDFPGLINNEVKIKRENDLPDQVALIKAEVIRARFQSDGQSAYIRVHRPSGMIVG